MSTGADNGRASDIKKARQLIAGLYDADMGRRFASARALGEFAGAHPDLIKKVWNRVFYAFDDTMSCWGVAEGLGEVARNVAGMRIKILRLLRKFEDDEASCQGFIWAVCRIGQVDREIISGFVQDLIDRLSSPTPCMLGQAIWALGELGISQSAETIRGMTDDMRETWIYENEGVVRMTIGEIAKQALGKLSA